MAKRNGEQTSPISEKLRRTGSIHCVIHCLGIPSNSKFTSFSNVKSDPSEKLSYLQSIQNRRLSEPHDSQHRMKDMCDIIPESLEGLDLEITGYHRDCYKRFTQHLLRLKQPSTPTHLQATPSKYHSPRKHVSAAAVKKFVSDECIFCDRNAIKVNGTTQKPSQTFAAWKNRESGWQKIEKMAEALGNFRLYRKIEGVDLYAADAHFHEQCYHRFCSDYHNHQEKVNRRGTEYRIAAAHNAAYGVVKELLKTEVLDNLEVMPLTSLRDRYIVELDAQGVSNPDFRTSKLKGRIENDKDLKSAITFSKIPLNGINDYFSFWVVYSVSLTKSDAIACAYWLGKVDHVRETALCLREIIQKAYKDSADLPWPPTADELDQRSRDELPTELKRFLNFVLSGYDSGVQMTERINRLVYSIGEDLCRAVTNGQWKLSKHLLLCTTIRHMYRSKQLTTILNKLGHCEPYDFGLELETAIAEAVEAESTFLTPNIVCGEGSAVFHNEWDNLNRITTNVHGSNVVNCAAGIMIQERTNHSGSSADRTLPLFDRTKRRSLTLTTTVTLPPVTIYNRESPKFPENSSFMPPDDVEMAASIQEYYVWLICR